MDELAVPCRVVSNAFMKRRLPLVSGQFSIFRSMLEQTLVPVRHSIAGALAGAGTAITYAPYELRSLRWRRAATDFDFPCC